MEHFDEEIQIKQYDSKLMKRLLSFTKPFKKYFAVVMLLMVISTVFTLIMPVFMKTAIDDYINGFRMPVYEVTQDTYKSVNIHGSFFIKVPKGDISFEKNKVYSIAYYNKKAYLVEGSLDYSNDFIIENNILIQGDKSHKIFKELSKSEINSLRNKDINGLTYMVIVLLAIYVLGFIVNYTQIYILQYTGQKIVVDIRNKLFTHIEGLSLSFFDKTPVGKLVTRLTNDVQTLNEMYTGVLIFLIKDVFMLFGIVLAMFMLNVKLTMISIITVPFIFFTAVLFKKYDRAAYRKVRSRLSKINAFLSENISGMKIVQTYHKEEKKFIEFDNINTAYKDASMEQTTVFAVFRPIIELLSSITMALVIWYGSSKIIRNELGFGLVFAFVNYITMFFQPIFDLTEKYDLLQSSMASSERIFELLDNKSIIQDPVSPKKVARLRGKIEFKNVWFAYNEDDWVLKDVSFTINPGEKIAFVGATGAGKTSIISLITRLYDIQKGEILIDGINIKDMKQEDLRKNVAAVLQDVFLFTGDIKSNVRLNESSITDEDIIKACRYVNADKFIEKLPKAYDSPVNERGTTLSQGQRQLISFARAIAFDPPI
ncbi:ABC transporter ATP-binding protein, partial [Clostridium polynesiense]|uniref:ABC transporter ATP-binding protein n=1 Tax=Clostridium polynesiense TaxID=1325933 RepID=UPI00058BF8BB